MFHQLEIDSVILQYQGKSILSDVYISSKTGTITGLLGRNGAGKSSLLKIIFGSLTPTQVSRQIDGKSLTTKPYRKKQIIHYLPQHHFIPSFLSLQSIFNDFNVHFEEFISFFPEFKNHYKRPLGQLSTGEKRIIEVFCILKTKGAFCLLDEPFTFLAPLQIETCKTLIKTEAKHKGFIITDHQYKHVLNIADTVSILENGQTRFIHHPEDLQKLGYNPHL